MFTNMVDILQEGISGDYKIQFFELNEERVKNLQFNSMFSFSYREYRDIKPGQYVKLSNSKHVWMSDTQMEKTTNSEFIENAKGDVFISGLGIGLVLPPLLKKPEVTSITVLEKEQDVIDLVAKFFPSVNIIKGDVFEYEPTQTFDTIYHDIWPEINQDNLEQMHELIRKYKSFLNDNGWINCWRYMYLLGEKHQCSSCDGDGSCNQCQGDGQEEAEWDDEGEPIEYEDCPECEGSGTCPDCDSLGVDLDAMREECELNVDDNLYF